MLPHVMLNSVYHGLPGLRGYDLSNEFGERKEEGKVKKKTAERRGNCMGLAISRIPSLDSEWVSAFLAFLVSLTLLASFRWPVSSVFLGLLWGISVFFWCPVGCEVREPVKTAIP